MTLDIHDYMLAYEQTINNVKGSALSQRNVDLIFAYRDACLLNQVCGKPRLIRAMQGLIWFGRQLGKDFDKAEKDDIRRVIADMLNRQPSYSPETIKTKKAIIKRFMTWLSMPDQFPNAKPPEIVSWIKINIKAKDEKKLQRKDLLTPQDIEALLHSCHNPRDKALISILWETGARIAEVGNMQIKHITKAKHGYVLDLTGKTGQRSPLIISSAPFLSQWLNMHPFKDNPESPLWVHYQYANQPMLLRYSTIRSLLRRHFRRAGIQKPFHPHIFRHSRATYVLANAIFNESQAKAYFGWAADSRMLATYSHLIDQDANNAVLRENNLTTVQKQQEELKPTECRICGELNQPKSEYCIKCGAVLDMKKAYEHQTLHQLKEEVFLNLFKILVEKGLVDEAAKEIHEAGLGPKLQRLAQHISQEKPISQP